MELVTLTMCWNSIEAELLKNRLEDAGIPCILQGETSSSVQIGAGLGNQAFRIPILVRQEDLRSAQQFLEEK